MYCTINMTTMGIEISKNGIGTLPVYKYYISIYFYRYKLLDSLRGYWINVITVLYDYGNINKKLDVSLLTFPVSHANVTINHSHYFKRIVNNTINEREKNAICKGI